MSVRLKDFSRAQIGAMAEVLKEALDSGFAETRGSHSESGLVYAMVSAAETVARVEIDVASQDADSLITATRSVIPAHHQLIHNLPQQLFADSDVELIAECACGWCSEPVTVYGAATGSAISEANRRGIAHLIDMGSKGNGVITWPDWAKP